MKYKNHNDSTKEILLNIEQQKKEMNQIYHDKDTLEPFLKKSQDRIEKRSNKKGDFDIMLPSHNEVIGNKSFPYNSYAALMINSNFNPANKGENYIYKKDIKKKVTDFMEEAKAEFPDGKITAPRQIERHIKTMLECDIPLLKVENTKNGVVYKLTPKIDGKYYVRLPYKQVRELIVSTNKNMLKLFVILSYICNTESYTTIDRKFLVRQLGLSDKSDNNIKSISIMTTSLAKLGFIEIKVTRKEDEEGYKTINSYRLRTFEEYEEINRKARGIK